MAHKRVKKKTTILQQQGTVLYSTNIKTQAAYIKVNVRFLILSQPPHTPKQVMKHNADGAEKLSAPQEDGKMLVYKVCHRFCLQVGSEVLRAGKA